MSKQSSETDRLVAEAGLDIVHYPGKWRAAQDLAHKPNSTNYALPYWERVRLLYLELGGEFVGSETRMIGGDYFRVTAEISALFPAQVMDYVQTIADGMVLHDQAIATLLVGRRARVISKYNGQQFGRSARPWTGREVTIQHAFYSRSGHGPHVTVWLKEERVGGGSAALGLDELELLP